MGESLFGLEETYLLMHVEIAHQLGEKMQAGTATRGEGHRLIESLHVISDATGTAPHQLWVEYCGHGWCGPSCECRRAA